MIQRDLVYVLRARHPGEQLEKGKTKQALQKSEAELKISANMGCPTLCIVQIHDQIPANNQSPGRWGRDVSEASGGWEMFPAKEQE
jgi:hypothetical protein